MQKTGKCILVTGNDKQSTDAGNNVVWVTSSPFLENKSK